MNTQNAPDGVPTDPTDTEQQGVAALLDRIWAAPTAPRRGPKPGLSVEKILDAAAAVADAEGLDAVSMARVGKELGVSPMALYRHVGSKDELLVRLSDAIAKDLPDIPAGAGWREGLEAWMRVQIDLAMARPWFLELPLSTVLPGPHRLRWIEQAFRLLADLPLAADEKLGLVGMLAQHVLGEARVQVEARRAAADPFADLEIMLQRYADPAEYPYLTRALATWQPPQGAKAHDLDAEIGFGLSLVLDGVEAYVARHVAAAETPSSDDAAPSSDDAAPSSDDAATA